MDNWSEPQDRNPSIPGVIGSWQGVRIATSRTQHPGHFVKTESVAMFYYYGRKKRIAWMYPEPTHDTVIEPFAGSAAYSLHGNNWKRDVILYDIDNVVIGIWRYLQQASVEDILSLPKLREGDSLVSFQGLSQEERWLIGFHLNPGSASPKTIVSRFNRWEAGRKYIAENLHKISHWQIRRASYKAAFPLSATWFIDPPYQSGGEHYRHSKIDYDDLGAWASSLPGQVIVAERDDATWLPFKPLTSYANIGTRVISEGIYVQNT